MLGDTASEAASTGLTVICDVAVKPSTDAVITVDPCATPCTRPLKTVATVTFELDHVIGRFGIAFPFWSVSTAVSCTFCAGDSVALGGSIRSAVATAEETERLARPTTASTIAPIVTFPTAMPVTTPEEFTVAMDG